MRPVTSIAWIVAAFVAVAVAVPEASSQAQGNGLLGYRNASGDWEWIEAAEMSTVGLKAEGSTHDVDDTFVITYMDVADGTGVGFDDPDEGEARRETMNDVLRYLSSVLDVPGRAELVIRSSQVEGRGALAAAGPFLIPRTGFQAGFVFDHLTTGRDPLADTPDGTVTIDFGYDWNASEEPPEPDEYDLYTVLLHELTHALGFVSIVGADGQSQLLNENGRGMLSVYDSLLLRGSTETPLFLEGGEINADGDDVSSNDVFLGAPRARDVLGDYPKVFAPSPFFEGSSIGHWSNTMGLGAVMVPALEAGVQKLRYMSWELQALADLGYDVIAEDVEPFDGGVPDPAPDDPPETPMPDQVIGPVPITDVPDPQRAPPPAAGGTGCSVGPVGVTPPWALIASYLVFVAFAARASSRRSRSAD